MATRIRVDQLLVERGLARSRETAQRLVLAGAVVADGRNVVKAGSAVDAGALLEVRSGPPYVSRGGEKLAHALAAFAVAVSERTCLDVGASTGGFTDCLLQAGAARVHAVDVGRGQLDRRLADDPRVVVRDGVNARWLARAMFAEAPPSLATVDVAFISLDKVLPAVIGCLEPSAEVVALVKPQFEAGREHVGRGGVVRDPARHRDVLERVAAFASARGWGVAGVTASPLRGPKGNREFFLHLVPDGPSAVDLAERLADVTRPVREDAELTAGAAP